jgi:ABC-type Fe3+ transport system permease subunit
VKSAASGGIILAQVLLMRRMPQERLEKPAAIVNFAAAATVGAIAYRNTRVVP